MSRAWASLPERSNAFWVWIIRFVALHHRLPARLLLYPITVFFVLVAREQRKASRVYLTRVLGRRATLWDVGRHIHTFAATLVDRVYFYTWQHWLLDLRVHNPEVVLERQQAGTAAILLGSHLGSFEVLRALGKFKIDLPFKILMYPEHNQVITRMINRLDPSFSKQIIEMGRPQTALEVYDALNGGHFVGMLGDRPDHNHKVVRCRILGREAVFPAGPILLAHACKVPVILFFGLYRGGNRYDVYLELLAERVELSRENRDQEIQQWMQRFADRLEYYVRQEPYNWFNFYDYWDEYSTVS